MSNEDFNEALAKLGKPMHKRKSEIYSSSSSSSSSSSDEASSTDTDESFYCRFCNLKSKGLKDRKPQDEVCSNCIVNFPEKMFCKSCKRFFPDRKPFTKAKDRCNFCCEKLEKAREARKRRREECLDKFGKADKKEERKKAKKEEESYVSLFINGQCIFKKHFSC